MVADTITTNRNMGNPTVLQLFLEFLKIGSVAFGGPAAHAALMEQELVSRKKWLTPQLFLDFLGAVNLIPGPNSTQMTMLVGYKLRGFSGMLATGFGFILPATLITGLLAWLYVAYGQIPAVEGLFFGLKPAVIAVIAGAILKLGKKALKGLWLGLLGVITLAATLIGLNEITAILGAGALGMVAYTIWRHFRGRKRPGRDRGGPEGGREGPGRGREGQDYSGERGGPEHSEGRSTPGRSQNDPGRTPKGPDHKNGDPGRPPKDPDHKSDNPGSPPKNDSTDTGSTLKSLAPLVLLNAGLTAAAQYSILKLFWVFFKIGALLFGTGYVLVAYLDGELVEKLGWITREQLLDAIAIGQFTPGPILSSATFVGYLLDGVPGAAVATLGIFLPSFAFILILYPIIPRLRRSPYTAAFLDSVNMAAVAVMASVTIMMTTEVAADWRAGAILAAALAAVIGLKKISAVWIILGGAIAGYLLILFT
jgi:chromate transporter